MTLEKLLHGVAAWLAHTATLNLNESIMRQIGQPLANAVERAGDPALNEAAGLFETDADDAIDISLPLAEGMLGKHCAYFVSSLKVINAEVGGVGVRNINGDEGNVSLAEDVGDARRDGLLNLKLEDKVNAFDDKLLSVLNGDVRIEAVVEDEQFHAGGSGGLRDTCLLYTS